MHLYIGTNSRVAAIDPKTGVIVWQTDLRDPPEGQALAAGPVVTLLEQDGRLFVGCCGTLFALDPATGKMLWSNGLKGLGMQNLSLCMGGASAQPLPRSS